VLEARSETIECKFIWRIKVEDQILYMLRLTLKELQLEGKSILPSLVITDIANQIVKEYNNTN
jgi:hypothetical protein